MNKEIFSNLLQAGENVYEEIATKHGCGWMDGGCFTFAKAVNEIFPNDTAIFHISRNRTTIDHAVVYFPEQNVYLDADGVHSINKLFKKMKEIEGVDASLCAPLYNIDDQVIYDDIKNSLKKEFDKLTK